MEIVPNNRRHLKQVRSIFIRPNVMSVRLSLGESLQHSICCFSKCFSTFVILWHKIFSHSPKHQSWINSLRKAVSCSWKCSLLLKITFSFSNLVEKNWKYLEFIMHTLERCSKLCCFNKVFPRKLYQKSELHFFA